MPYRYASWTRTAVGCLLLLPLLCLGEETNSSWSGVDRIVAVGDVHGDADALAGLLRAAGVTDRNGKWVGGKTHLVQTGDVMGRGPESRRAMDLLRQLERAAAAAGGRVHALIGNHEAMVLTGDFRYVDPGEIASFGGEERFRAALAPEGEYGQWIRGHNAVIRINDTLFLHGGLSRAYAEWSLADLNACLRAELTNARPSQSSILFAPDGPLWHRGYAFAAGDGMVGDLATVRKTFHVRHIVVGHTVARKGIGTTAEGRVIMIDVGMSRFYYGGQAACLLIENGRFFVVTMSGRTALPVAEEPVAPVLRGPSR